MMISKEARNTSEGQPNIAHLDEFLGPCKKIENYFIVSSDLKRDSRSPLFLIVKTVDLENKSVIYNKV